MRRRAIQLAVERLEKGKEELLYGHLLELIEDPSFPVRYDAIEKLEKIGDVRAVPKLQARSNKENDERIRKSIAAAIRKIQDRNP
jgi:HEAT repeat protein